MLSKKEICTPGRARLNVRVNLGYLEEMARAEFDWFHTQLPRV